MRQTGFLKIVALVTVLLLASVRLFLQWPGVDNWFGKSSLLQSARFTGGSGSSPVPPFWLIWYYDNNLEVLSMTLQSIIDLLKKVLVGAVLVMIGINLDGVYHLYERHATLVYVYSALAVLALIGGYIEWRLRRAHQHKTSWFAPYSG
jgi:hypothetical protein